MQLYLSHHSHRRTERVRHERNFVYFRPRTHDSKQIAARPHSAYAVTMQHDSSKAARHISRMKQSRAINEAMRRKRHDRESSLVAIRDKATQNHSVQTEEAVRSAARNSGGNRHQQRSARSLAAEHLHENDSLLHQHCSCGDDEIRRITPDMRADARVASV